MADKRIDQYPLKPSPVSADYALIQDSEDLDVNGIRKYKKATIGTLPEANNVVGSYTRTELLAFISSNELIIGSQYIITDAVSSTLVLLVEAISTNKLDDIVVNTLNGDNYTYNITTDLVVLIPTPIALGTSNQVLGVNNGATAQEYKTVQGTANRVSVNHTANTITLTTPQDITTTSDVEFGKLKLNNIVPLEDEFAIIGQAINDSIGTVDNAYFISSLDLLTNAVADSTYLTTIEGIAAGGELSGNYASPTLVNSAVTGKVLTGLSVTGSAVVSTDSVLAAIGKLQNQVNGLAGGVEYQGTWNASTNTPTLTSSVGTQGFYYVVSVAGSTNLNGITTWELGDWAIFNGSTWQKVDNTDAVVSVNGYTGIVTLSATDVSAVPTSSISGTSGTIPLFGASNTLGDSIITQSGGNIAIGGGFVSYSGFSVLTLSNATNGGLLAIRNASEFGLNIFGTNNGGVIGAINGTKSLIFQTNDIDRLQILSNGQIITANATDTGEHFIIGGSARVNGTSYLGGTTTIYGGNLNVGQDWTSAIYSNTARNIKLESNGGTSGYFIQAAYQSAATANTTFARQYVDAATSGNLIFQIGNGNFTVSNGNPSSYIDWLTVTSSGAATFSSSVTASSLIKSGGTSSQYLMADGSTSTLTNPITGTGTTNYLPKFTGASALGNSVIYDDGTNVNIGTTSGNVRLTIKQNFDNYTGGICIKKSNNDTSLFLYNNGSANIISSSYGSSGGYVPLYFQTSDLNRLVIDTDGSILINTTVNAGYKLDVNGTARVSGAATFSSSVAIGNTVSAAIGVASTHKVTMVIGGVTYYLLATT